MAQFEASIDESDSIDRARDVFEQAYKTLRTANDKEERLMLVEHWLDFEVGIKTQSYFCKFVFLFRENEVQKKVWLGLRNIYQNVLNNVEKFLQKMELVDLLLVSSTFEMIFFRMNQHNGKNICNLFFRMMKLFNLI
jgi:hypothetical protein